MMFSQVRRIFTRDVPRLSSQQSRLLRTLNQRVLPVCCSSSGSHSIRAGCQPQDGHKNVLLQPQCQSSLPQAASIFSQVDASKLPRYDPEKGKLVYVGTMSHLIKFVKRFSLSTSIIGLLLQPYLYTQTGDQHLVVKIAVGGTLSFFIFLTPILLHWVTKRYVTQMHWDARKELFTATTYTLLVKERITQFKASEVTFPQVPGLFTTVYVKGCPMFVDPELFMDKEAYIKLMGYDKPIEWQMLLSDADKHNAGKNEKI